MIQMHVNTLSRFHVVSACIGKKYPITTVKHFQRESKHSSSNCVGRWIVHHVVVQHGQLY